MTDLLWFFMASIFGIGSILFVCFEMLDHRDALHKMTHQDRR